MSAGLTVDGYLGAFYSRRSSDINWPALSSDSAVIALLSHDDKLGDEGRAYLQFALLYTTVLGERRIRCAYFGGRAATNLPNGCVP